MTVSRHAIRRYCERKKVGCPNAARASIIELLDGAEELELKPRFRVHEVLNHRDHARFFRAAGLVFVVMGSNVLSCHAGTAKRWRKAHTRHNS